MLTSMTVLKARAYGRPERGNTIRGYDQANHPCYGLLVLLAQAKPLWPTI